jgi:signal transduction histidine kinase
MLFAHGAPPATAALAAIPPLPDHAVLSFVTLIVLCTVTAFTLPRQFHLGFVTLEDVADLRSAAVIVPVYFGLWVAATLVIAVGVRVGLGAGDVDAHLQVLAVPLRHGGPVLALVALIGGLSAGGAMVIVETTAIAAMVSNEIVLPLCAGWMRARAPGADLGRVILTIRRATGLCIALLAWVYFLGIRDREGTMQLGLTALAAFAQLAPALFGGIWWRRGHSRGALAGIIAGLTVWALALAGPDLVLARGATIFGLWPQTQWMPYLAVLASLAVNAGLFVLVSLRSSPSLIDTIQANSFVARAPTLAAAPSRQITATVAELRHLLAQFLGPADADRALGDFRRAARSADLPDSTPVTPALARSAERVLAGVIGAPSARNVVAIALAAGSQEAAEISRILDEAGHAVHFSRELLQTTLDSLSQGVCVIDGAQNLVAWNQRWLALTATVAGDVYAGKPLSAVIDVAGAGHRLCRHLGTRMSTMAQGQALHDEIAGADDRVVQVTGRALGNGDYLLTLADITDIKQAERVLARTNEELERLVDDRTAQLSAARTIAEQATGAQRRFVAAASHDLVQPLHAARLFIGNAMIAAPDNPAQADLLQRADQAVESAHRLLRALLNLSQLETGARQPRLEPVDAGALLAGLADEFAAQAAARGLDLIVLPTTQWVLSDRDLLRSMLQNLLVNALRYTPQGRVLVALRRAGTYWRFEVRDSGVGIDPARLPAAFGEYSRLADGQRLSEGAGLGLSIVARIAQMLDHPVTVRSRPGAGSTFAVVVPAAGAPQRRVPRGLAPVSLNGLSVLCVDDEPDVLLGTAALLQRWGAQVTACADAGQVPDGQFDVALVDYHLDGGDGLDLLRALSGRARLRLLVTATSEDGWADALAAEGIMLLGKPVAPLELRAILASAVLPDQATPDRSRASASN